MSRSTRLAVILGLLVAPALGGCVVTTVAGAAVGVTVLAVGTTAKVAGAAVGVAADGAGAAGHAVFGGGKKPKSR